MNNNLDNLEMWLTSNNISYKEKYEVRYSSWIKAGGVINYFITPENTEGCVNLIKYFQKNKIKFYILGNQSNTIIRDGVVLTPIINLNKMNKLTITETENGVSVLCEGGVSIPRFSKNVIKKGFTGTEGLLGIPGSVGGGICMNASSYGNELTNYLSKVRIVNEKGEEIELKKSELELRWRGSIIKGKKSLITHATFLIPKNKYIGKNLTTINSQKIIDHRKTFQENDLPNLGSIFATRDIYRDLSKKNFIFFVVYLFYKLSSIYYFNLNKKKLSTFRKNFIKLYLRLLELDKFETYTSSSKTLNCLVNKGSSSSTEAIHFLKTFKKNTKNCLNIENIILDEIN